MKPFFSSVVMCLCTVASDVSFRPLPISSKLGAYPCLVSNATRESRTSFCLLVRGMFTPPLANLFQRHFRRKESERQASFFLRVAFTAPFRAKSESDIQAFDGLLSESLDLCDFRRGRGHLGQPLLSSVLFSRIIRVPTGQVAWRLPRIPPICEKHYAGHPRHHDVSLPLWCRHRHWADL